MKKKKRDYRIERISASVNGIVQEMLARGFMLANGTGYGINQPKKSGDVLRSSEGHVCLLGALSLDRPAHPDVVVFGVGGNTLALTVAERLGISALEAEELENGFEHYDAEAYRLGENSLGYESPFFKIGYRIARRYNADPATTIR